MCRARIRAKELECDRSNSKVCVKQITKVRDTHHGYTRPRNEKRQTGWGSGGSTLNINMRKRSYFPPSPLP